MTEIKNFKDLPDYPSWLSEEAVETLNNKYLTLGESPKDAYLHIAKTTCEYLDRLDLLEDLFYCLYNGWIGPASAFFSNFGRGEGLPISCNSVYFPDSIKGIYSKGLSEMAILSQNGAGVAAWIGDIRAAGAPIGKDKLGKSVGVLPVAKLIDDTGSYVSQNAKRPGAVAVWLDIEHTDVPSLLISKDHLQGDVRKHLDCNIGLSVSDDFMNKVISGEPKACSLWARVLETQLKAGSPYLMFKDTVNRLRPEGYKNNNLKIKGSNICLSGDTLVATKQGQFPIKDLVGKTVDIFDGKDWVSNSNFFSAGFSKVYRIELSNGQVIKATPYHKFPVNIKNSSKSYSNKIEILTADNLTTSMRFIPHNTSVKGFKEVKGAYLKGFLLGDGTSINNRALLYLYSNKFICEKALINSAEELNIEHINTNAISKLYFSEAVEYKNEKYFGVSIRKSMKGLSCRKQALYPWVSKYRKKLPNISEWTRKSRLEFISGLFDADGSGSRYLQLSSINEQLCKDIADVLFSLGYNPNLDTYYAETSKQMFRVSISSWDTFNLFKEGYFQRLSWKGKPPNRNCTNNGRKIKSIVLEDEVQEVFCTNVPTTNQFALACNVMSMNCVEITLYQDELHTFVCCLCSLNLIKWFEWKDWVGESGLTVPALATYLLEAGLDDYVAKGKNIPGLECAIRSVLKERAVG